MTIRQAVGIRQALVACLGSAVLVAGATGGCAKQTRPAEASAARVPRMRVATDWRRVVTPGDLTRLHGWRDAFVTALAQARAHGFGPVIAREGALLEPDAALVDVAMPSGRYRCRTIKLGAKGPGNPAYVAYTSFDCAVAGTIADRGEVASFAKLSGSQRPVGLVFAHDARREIFVGTLMLGDERQALEYGRDADRDMVGAFERVGDKRWRLVLPYPRFESLTDVVELVPAT